MTFSQNFRDVIFFLDFSRPGNNHLKIPWLFQVFHDRTNIYIRTGKRPVAPRWRYTVVAFGPPRRSRWIDLNAVWSRRAVRMARDNCVERGEKSVVPWRANLSLPLRTMCSLCSEAKAPPLAWEALWWLLECHLPGTRLMCLAADDWEASWFQRHGKANVTLLSGISGRGNLNLDIVASPLTTRRTGDSTLLETDALWSHCTAFKMSLKEIAILLSGFLHIWPIDFQDFSRTLNQISMTKLKSQHKHEQLCILRAYAGLYCERPSLKKTYSLFKTPLLWFKFFPWLFQAWKWPF